MTKHVGRDTVGVNRLLPSTVRGVSMGTGRHRRRVGGTAHDRARADAHLLGHDVLPLRLPCDFDCAVRAQRQRRARLRAASSALHGDRRATSLRPGPLLHSAATLARCAYLVRIRVGLDYSPQNLFLMIAIYVARRTPLLHRRRGDFAGVRAAGRTASTCSTRPTSSGAAARMSAPDSVAEPARRAWVVMTAATLSMAAALCFAAAETRWRVPFAALVILAVPSAAQLAGREPFAVVDTKGHLGDRACSASGTRSRASRCTTGRMATGR